MKHAALLAIWRCMSMQTANKHTRYAPRQGQYGFRAVIHLAPVRKGQQLKCCDFYAILKLTEDELSFVKYEFERKFES